MAIVWHHTPGHYTTPNVSQFWSAAHADVTVHATNGYGGTPALSGSSLAAYLRRDFLASVGLGFGIGCRIKIVSLPATEKILLGLTKASGDLAVCLSVLPDGRLAAYRGEQESLLAIYDGPIATGSQVRLGFKGVIGSGSTGRVAIYVGGIPVTVVTGIDTGNDPWAGIYLGPGSDIYLSHLYATNNDTLYGGYLVDVVLSSDAAVDDADPDGDTTVIALAEGDSVDVPLSAPPARVLTYGIQTIVDVKAIDSESGFAPTQTIEGVAYVEDRRQVSLTYGAVDSDFRSAHPTTGLPLTSDDIAAFTVGGEAQA